MCKIISDSIEELDKLVEAYPRCIPLAAAAEFLGMTPETLRTIPFYLFVTQGHIL